MKDETRHIIINSIVSIGIGVVVALVEIVYMNFEALYLVNLLQYGLIGLFIGTTIHMLFTYGFKHLTTNGLFIVSALVLAVFSITPGILQYFINGTSLYTFKNLFLLLTAELLGMSFTYSSYLKYKRFNSKLMEKKQALSQVHKD